VEVRNETSLKGSVYNNEIENNADASESRNSKA